MPFDLYILYNPLAPLITRSKEDLSRQKSHAAAFRLTRLLLFFFLFLFCFYRIFFVFVAVVAPAHFVFQTVKSFVLTRLDNVAIEPGKKESNHTRKWCLIYCRPRRRRRRRLDRPCLLDRTKSDDILPFNSLKRDPFRPVCPSGRVPTAAVVTVREGRTELTGNIDDERPTSPDRT
jgi:hypothetical protein